ncbi:MAG: DUF2799 domain-containing protein [Caulobacterales bacterium]
MRRILIVLSLGVLAGSCETMSADECRLADWGSLGYRDGAAGSAVSRFTDREKSCAKKGYAAQFDSYMKARDDGLRSFCQPERGFRAAMDGYQYAGVCPRELEPDFMLGYSDGRIAYQAKQAVADRQSEINSLRWKIDDYEDKIVDKRAIVRDPKATPEQKAEAQKKLDELEYDRKSANKDLRRAEDDLSWRENDLSRVRDDLGLRWGAW